MNCYHCENLITKSWLHLQNIPVEKDGIISNVDKHICGYSCYKRLNEKNIIPKDLWSHTVNRSDYDGLIRPIMKQSKKTFEYLTLSEIQNLKESDNVIRMYHGPPTIGPPYHWPPTFDPLHIECM